VSVSVDANVLVYASNEADPVYEPALELVERLAAGPGLVYLFWPVLVEYLRIVTHAAILPRPLSARDAVGNVDSLLAQPTCGHPASSTASGTSFERRGPTVPAATTSATCTWSP